MSFFLFHFKIVIDNVSKYLCKVCSFVVFFQPCNLVEYGLHLVGVHIHVGIDALAELLVSLKN